MKAVKKFIGMGEDAIVVKGVDNLLTTEPSAVIRCVARTSLAIFRSGRVSSCITNGARTSRTLMVNKERIVEVEWAEAIRTRSSRCSFWRRQRTGPVCSPASQMPLPRLRPAFAMRGPMSLEG